MTALPTSETGLFLHYLHAMDADKIDLLLDDSADCFGVSKVMFIERLRKVFYNLSYTFKPFETFVEHGKNPNSYQWVLPKEYNDKSELIFRCRKGKIKGIYNHLDPKDEIEHGMINDYHFLFARDEKRDFIPSADYLILKHQCQSVYSEMVNVEGRIITSNDMRNWMAKHAQLFAETGPQYYYQAFYDFNSLYKSFDFYILSINKYIPVLEALQNFPPNERQIPNWLVKYNRLFFCDVMGFEDMNWTPDWKRGLLKENHFPFFSYSGDDFFKVMQFAETYFLHYQRFFE